jgi:hypothetical protein
LSTRPGGTGEDELNRVFRNIDFSAHTVLIDKMSAQFHKSVLTGERTLDESGKNGSNQRLITQADFHPPTTATKRPTRINLPD